MAQDNGKGPKEYISIIITEPRHDPSMMVEAIEKVMRQHYRITRGLDDSDEDDEEGREGTQ